MPDVAERIREHLDAVISGSPATDDWGDHWEDYDKARNALLAVLDATDPDTLPPNGCDCVGCLREWVRQSIVEALGMIAP